ncbi:hypothetical protein KCP74_13805 [Salmonella enterica subsp. enterica]|nr:hypothetical protein KCP74_13805 [Salmonella enterica subsp. enterica]
MLGVLRNMAVMLIFLPARRRWLVRQPLPFVAGITACINDFGVCASRLPLATAHPVKRLQIRDSVISWNSASRESALANRRYHTAPEHGTPLF